MPRLLLFLAATLLHTRAFRLGDKHRIGSDDRTTHGRRDKLRDNISEYGKSGPQSSKALGKGISPRGSRTKVKPQRGRNKGSAKGKGHGKGSRETNQIGLPRFTSLQVLIAEQNKEREAIVKKKRTVKYIKISSLPTDTPYLKSDSKAPECLQGIMYMDQACVHKDQLEGVKCSFLPPKRSGREYTLGLAEWATGVKAKLFGGPLAHGCFRLAVRGSWTIGSPKSTGSCMLHWLWFCQGEVNAAKFKPCDVGARFEGVGNPLYASMAFKKTSWGWDRTTLAGTWHYPLLRIVDGSGKKTQFWDGFYKEVTRTDCDYPLECRRNILGAATQELGVCVDK